jgi:hypothetical protein
MRTAKVSRFFFIAGLHAINGCKNSHVFGKTKHNKHPFSLFFQNKETPQLTLSLTYVLKAN